MTGQIPARNRASSRNVFSFSWIIGQQSRDSESDDTSGGSDLFNWEMVAEAGLLLETFLRTMETVHQSAHTTCNGYQLEITLTRLRGKRAELLEAVKRNTIDISFPQSQEPALQENVQEAVSLISLKRKTPQGTLLFLTIDLWLGGFPWDRPIHARLFSEPLGKCGSSAYSQGHQYLGAHSPPRGGHQGMLQPVFHIVFMRQGPCS